MLNTFSISGTKFIKSKNKYLLYNKYSSSSYLYLFSKLDSRTIIYTAKKCFYKKNRLVFMADSYISIDENLDYKIKTCLTSVLVYPNRCYYYSSNYSDINRMLKSADKNKCLL